MVETHLQGLHELPCARLGDGTQVVDQVSLGHPDASVTDGECVVVLVGDNGDLHLLLRLQDCRIGQTLVPDLVQSLGVEDNTTLLTHKIRLTSLRMFLPKEPEISLVMYSATYMNMSPAWFISPVTAH